MTSATERLRAMLDERGVEWWQSANTLGCIFTRWYSPLFGDEVCAMENGDGELELFSHLMTPEQAITSTLGDSVATGERHGVAKTCHLKPWEMEHDTGFYDCMECDCGYVADVADWAEWHSCPRCGRRIAEEDE